MRHHEKPFGNTDVHLTPKWVLDGLGPFDLDPCANANWQAKIRQTLQRVGRPVSRGVWEAA